MRFEISKWNGLSESSRSSLILRPVYEQAGLTDAVAKIITQVKSGGNKKLIEYAKKYDGLISDSIVCEQEQINQQAASVKSDLKSAIDEAYERIRDFHTVSKPKDYQVQTAPGVSCATRYRGYESIGIYIPGGSAPLISTVMMLGIPAQIAGVNNIYMCTPLKQASELNSGIAYAAAKCGIANIYAIGGAHAIAALAYGTETVPRVQKIFGPGNAWVTEAKQQVAFDPQGAAIDMPAGPSEVMVIADKNANADFVAIDLLSQAEHGPDSQAIVLSDDETLLQKVATALARQLQELSRQDILKKSQKHIRLALVSDLELALSISNDYAPEHLILQTDKADEIAEQVTNAGSVFIGAWAPESLGDYCSGTNHVLPTYGFARSYNGLSTSDFMQKTSFQKVTQQGIQNIGPCAMTLADAEGLDAHSRAVAMRLDVLAKGAKQ